MRHVAKLLAPGLLAIATLTAHAEEAPPPVPDLLGKEAPAFQLPAVAGGNVALQELRKKLVVIHFAASW